MPFDFCTKHQKRYEAGRSVCIGCHQMLLAEARANKPNIVRLPAAKQSNNVLDHDALESNKPNGFDKKTYQRDLMRKNRAAAKAAKGSP